jgi:hypothetical protein
MRKEYEEPILMIEKFDLNESIALTIYDGSSPDIGEGPDGEDFEDFD